MSTALKVTYPEKTNNPSDPDAIRKFYATEANDLRIVTSDHADQIELLKTKIVASGNPDYGRYTSLALLQAAHPVGEPNAFAVIDAGTGITPLIAIWDDDDELWELSGAVDNTIEVLTYATLPAPGTEGKWYVTKDKNALYRWYNGRYNLIGGSVSVSATTSNKYPFTATENQTMFQVPGNPDTIDFILGGNTLFEGTELNNDDYSYNPLTGTAISFTPQPSGIKITIRGFQNVFRKKQPLIIAMDGQTEWNLPDKPKQVDVNFGGNILFENEDYTYNPDTGDFEITEDFYIDSITTFTKIELIKIF